MVPGAPAAFPRNTPSSASVPPCDDRTAQPSGLRKLRTKRRAGSACRFGCPCRRQSPVPGPAFSKYDTVHLILTTDFPAIPENQRQEIALRLVRICAPIFRAYDLKDDFSERPEFRQLKEELRTGIRTWIDENGVPGYRSPARKEKPPVPYSEQPRYPKRNKRK